jgi:hypothetical protein
MRKVLTVVHCYQGDGDHVATTLPWHRRHGEVLILSPADSPVEIDGVECRSAGLAGWGGEHTVERQYEHWKIAAEHDADWFLMNDADSFALWLPEYVFEEDVFWSNFKTPYEDNDNFRDVFYVQPPFFMSRYILERFIAAGVPPYDRIDMMYVGRAKELGMRGKPFRPWNTMFTHPKKEERQIMEHETRVGGEHGSAVVVSAA